MAGHGSWAWPGAVLTGFGWLLVVNGGVCLLAPDWTLRRRTQELLGKRTRKSSKAIAKPLGTKQSRASKR